MSLGVKTRPVSHLAKVASAAGFVDTEDDQNERNRHQHPAGMTTARSPKVADSTIQVGAADEQAGREPRVPLEPFLA